MKTTLLATVAILGLAGGAVIADRAQVSLPQLARGWHPSADTQRSTEYAVSGKPEVSTDGHATQLAQGWHPSGDTSRSTQYAASGKPESQTDVRGIQYSASGLSQAETNQSSSA